jgi:hypothetical protein
LAFWGEQTGFASQSSIEGGCLLGWLGAYLFAEEVPKLSVVAVYSGVITGSCKGLHECLMH